MRTNRVMRDKIEELHGVGVVDEVRRWNDLDTDSLDSYGVPVSALEERLQQDVLELMSAEELAMGEAA